MTKLMIYDKINQAVKLLCEVYDILNNIKDEKTKENPIYLSMKDFSIKHPTFTQGALRHFYHTNHQDFNNECTVKIRGKILIDEEKFFK